MNGVLRGYLPYRFFSHRFWGGLFLVHLMKKLSFCHMYSHVIICCVKPNQANYSNSINFPPIRTQKSSHHQFHYSSCDVLLTFTPTVLYHHTLCTHLLMFLTHLRSLDIHIKPHKIYPLCLCNGHKRPYP